MIEAITIFEDVQHLLCRSDHESLRKSSSSLFFSSGTFKAQSSGTAPLAGVFILAIPLAMLSKRKNVSGLKIENFKGKAAKTGGDARQKTEGDEFL